MCRVLTVSTSGYYCWLKRKPSATKIRREEIARKAEEYFDRAREKYGYRKVHEDLVQEGNIACCRETVRKLLAEKGLFFKRKRHFVVTTESGHQQPVAENILARDFTAEAPNQKWVADITYVPTQEGWLYLAVVMDLYSRKIVGWSMNDKINAALVKDAFVMAINTRHPQAGLIHHSDRGVQYASDDFQEILQHTKAICSMSRKGNCWDNAAMESFFGKLKSEQVNGKLYVNREEARLDIFWYIEVFYNRFRRHASLGYVSPEAFERRSMVAPTMAKNAA